MASPARLSASAVAARTRLREGREKIRTLHDRGLDGLQVCARLTSLVDSIVIGLFEAYLSELDSNCTEENLGSTSLSDQLRNQVALVSHGGYGRRHSAPFSDVDLMILYEGRSTSELTELARWMTQGIFDAGLQLGQSVRSVQEAIQMARTDPIVCTSLIDSRLLIGKQSLFDTYRTSFEKLVQKRSKTLIPAFLEAREIERNQYGEAVYLLEPQVKRSRGGLRELHLLRWLGFAEQGIADPDRRFQSGSISKLDHHRIVSARAFLLRLRNEMHFHADSAKETLDRAEQMRVAPILGYRGSQGMLPVEQFMRDYFRHTNHLWHLVRRREASLQISSKVVRVLDPMLSKKVDGQYRIGLRSISTTPAGLESLKSNLQEILNLIQLSARLDKRLDHVTWSTLYLAAPEFSEEIEASVAHSFLQMLADPQIVGEALRALHEMGLLEKILPPMHHARGLLQFNQYHQFTVDEHCLRAVQFAARFNQREDSLGEAYRAVHEKQILHLALLIHDLGKGFEEDHSEVGRRIATETAQRLGLTLPQTQDLEFLVHQHLMMAHLAFRRDTSDPQIIEQFAETVGSVDRLRMLLVVTCADLSAVGPGVFNHWKLEVLDTLFRRAARLLHDSDTTPQEQTSTAAKFENLRERILRQLAHSQKKSPWFQRQVEALPENYLTHRDPEEATEMLIRFQELPSGGADVWGGYRADTQTVEFLAGVDHGVGRGIFSSLAGALTSQGLEILAADTETLPDDLLLLRYEVAKFQIEDPQAANPGQKQIEAICQQMAQTIDSHEPPKFRRVWGQQQNEATAQLNAPPNRVRIDNRASDSSTLIEVFALNRTGLLYQLTRKLHDLELIIRHAKISTSLDQVVDVFYVTDRSGEKITKEQSIESIREQLLAVLESG